MSLLNFMVWPDRALVCVDTAGMGEGDATAELSKALLLPHTNVLFAYRGFNQVLLEVFGGCFRTQLLNHFDGINGWLQDSLDQGYERLINDHICPGGAESQIRMGAELVVVGYSNSAGAMQAMRYAREVGDREFSKTPQRAGLAPNAGWETVPMPDSIEAHERIARDQVAYVRREQPGAAIGGRLLSIQLTKDTATFREVCELG